MVVDFLEVALFGSDRSGGLTLLGRLTDPDLVEAVSERIAAQRRRELATLEPPVRPVPDPEPEDGPPAA